MTQQEFKDELKSLNEATEQLLKKRGELIIKIMQEGGSKKEILNTIRECGVRVSSSNVSGVRIISHRNYRESIRKFFEEG